MSRDNRRQHPRSEIEHPAELYYHDKTLPGCRIKNFSLGGIYLENDACDFPTLITTAVPQPGGPGIKHALIEIPRESGNADAFSVAVKITFVSENGIGVAFLQPNPVLYKYFRELQSNPENRSEEDFAQEGIQATPIDPMILGRMNKACGRFIKKRMPNFFSLCETHLPEEAEHAISDHLRTDLFYAQQILKQESSAITEAQIARIGDRLDHLLDPPESDEGSPNKLSISREMELIAKDEFDEWVVIIGLGHSIQSDIPILLHNLELGLSYLIKRPINNDTNPLSPTFFLWTLCNSLQQTEIGFPVRSILYELFKETILGHIDELYSELNDIFARNGVDTKVVALKSRSAFSGVPHTGSKPSRPQRKRNLVGTLASMLSAAAGKTENSAKLLGRPSATKSELLGALEDLKAGSARPIADQVARSLADERAKNLDSESSDTIATVEHLVASLQQEEQLGGGLKQLINAAKMPVLREALADNTLLDDADHPARALFQRIDQLSPYIDTAGSDTAEPLLQIIDQLASAPPGRNREQLQEATKRIESLLKTRRETFDHNSANVVESNRQFELNASASKIVYEQLATRLEGHSVAQLIARLLQCGWPGLLHKYATAEGDGKQLFKVYLGVIDFLAKLFPPDCLPGKLDIQRREKLLALMQRGFSDYPVHAKRAGILIEETETGLKVGGDECRRLIEPRVEINATFLRQLLDEQTPAGTEHFGTPLSDSKWGERIRALAEGDWIAQKLEGGQLRLINLTWKDSAETHFVFVDGNGNKALDIAAPQLEAQFSEGTLSLLESRELPMVDRAIERMLKNSFARVKQESRVDELTGLLNRRAFTRETEALRKLASTEGSHHALLLLDIDQFQMVNDLCGYEGGDKLLKEIAGIVTAYQQDRAVIARTGDDEFGILLSGTTVDCGYQAAENQRRALESYKFSWEQNSVPVSTSIGIVAIDNSSVSAQGLLKDASSACSLAKQSGRNCCRVFQHSDEALKKKERLIRSIPVIEDALENNRISLHGQLITPLFAGEGSDHYEVLLRLTDTSGKPTNPSEFISAAEQFDRMRSVDRWIFNTFFEWVKNHHSEIGNIEGFSLNISGQSIIDPAFRAFLLEHLDNCALSPKRIGFEITETAVVKNMEQVNAFMSEIQQLGSKFYLDDFGSGYASYSYLKDLAVDCIKIDGVFIKDILNDQSSQAMVNSITEIAHHMDKQVIAEYVETEAHVIALRELSVDFAQGYGVGLPQPLSTILQAAAAYA